MRGINFTKDPQARVDFTVDWSRWLADGETINESTWVVPAGLELDTQGNLDATATVWLTGGTPRQTYTVTNQITTTEGRVDQRSIYIACTDR